MKDVQVMLVHWPINPEAPFQFDLNFLDKCYSRETLNRDGLFQKVNDFQPDMILCSGWMDKDYVAICKHWHKKIPTVLSMDNHWTGSWKQQAARVLARFTLGKTFNRVFVPGLVQKEYALKLGFRDNQIETGFYSADTQKFDLIYQNGVALKKNLFPNRFLYIGRYVEHKGIFDMWEAFKLFRETNSEWELWCVGTGDQFENRVEGLGIRHFGFKQPSELEPILKETEVYILPSHFEPWGVSVHEMAAAGFPMILSDKIGSREAFLVENENGLIFPSGNVKALLDAMKSMASQNQEDLMKMGDRSHELGMMNTPEIWAEKLLGIVESRSEEGKS